jgi:hypothetical protein
MVVGLPSRVSASNPALTSLPRRAPLPTMERISPDPRRHSYRHFERVSDSIVQGAISSANHS